MKIIICLFLLSLVFTTNAYSVKFDEHQLIMVGVCATLINQTGHHKENKTLKGEEFFVSFWERAAKYYELSPAQFIIDCYQIVSIYKAKFVANYQKPI